MSILLDRLVGYDLDDDAGKTKIGVHPFFDDVWLHERGWTGVLTRTEINDKYVLSGAPFDPGNTQVDDLDQLIGLATLPGPARRDPLEIQTCIRAAEYDPTNYSKLRVAQMLGVV